MRRPKGFIGAPAFLCVFFIFASVRPGDVCGEWLDSLKMSQRAANDDMAEAHIKTLVTAAETFKAAHGRYPKNEDELSKPEDGPPYITRNYGGQEIMGYKYSVTFHEAEKGEGEAEGREAGYLFIAEPARCQETGTKVFTAESGKEITQEDCE